MRTFITFDKVGFKRTRKIKCRFCGKTFQRTEEFYQTINPYNRDENGFMKTPELIMQQERNKCEEWLKKEISHGCEKEQSDDKH